MLWALLTSRVRTELALATPYPSGVILEIGWWVLFIWPSGFYLGLVVGALFPKASLTGRFVWVLPSLAFAGFVVLDLIRHSILQRFQRVLLA